MIEIFLDWLLVPRILLICEVSLQSCGRSWLSITSSPLTPIVSFLCLQSLIIPHLPNNHRSPLGLFAHVHLFFLAFSRSGACQIVPDHFPHYVSSTLWMSLSDSKNMRSFLFIIAHNTYLLLTCFVHTILIILL